MSFTLNERLNRNTLFLLLLLLAAGVLSFLALLLPISSPTIQETLQVGSVAQRDYLAPFALTYDSAVLTAAQQDKQAAAVAPIYTPADTSIARQQLERLRSALAYISSVRADGYSSQEQKTTDLSLLKDIQIQPEMAMNILLLTDSRWLAVQQESIAVLEQVMRSTIREDRLDDARRGIPALISFSMPVDQANIVAELVSGFVVPNSLYDQPATDAARQQARLSVVPVKRSYMAGETIVQRGQIIIDSNLEALQKFDLLQSAFRWQDMAGAAVLTFLVLGFFIIYLRRRPTLINSTHHIRGLTLGTLVFLFYLCAARLIVPGHTVVPYLFPLASYSLLISILFGAEPALISSLPLAIMITYGLPGSLELTLYFVLGSFFSVLILGRGKRITTFFYAGLAISMAGIAVILAYHLPQPTSDWLGILTLAISSIVNGIASASITLLLQFFLAQILGQTTALQLMELSRPDHPLLQELLRTAPGTYQHSLQVANLAEQAAERIGADALLTRVGAMYHDIGKSVNPVFFIENQVPGNLNPHDDLDPALSAAMIIRHIKEGLNLAQQHRLPRRIQEFIIEHHGELITRYQYGKALEAVSGDASQVNLDDFRYPGPRPQSRETALLMLADGCEARVRAEHPKDETELRRVIQDVIAHRMEEGALKDTELTLHDLAKIEDSFVATLRGIYHPRIQYPVFEHDKHASEKTLPITKTPEVPLIEQGHPAEISETNQPEPEKPAPSPEENLDMLPVEFQHLLPKILLDPAMDPPADPEKSQDAHAT